MTERYDKNERLYDQEEAPDRNEGELTDEQLNEVAGGVRRNEDLNNLNDATVARNDNLLNDKNDAKGF